MSHALHVRLQHSFPSRGSGAFSLDIGFTATPGFTVLFGPSGAGKSTILECVAGLQRPRQGKVSIGGDTMFDSDAALHLPPQRRALGYVFQSLALFPHLSVRENVRFGIRGLSSPEQDARIRAALDSFHISHLAEAHPHTISGGERQRVALARALVTQPRALLLDEPLSALDLPIRRKVLADLKEWNLAHPIPVIYVTHSVEEAFSLGGEVIVLAQGRIAVQGSAASVLAEERSLLINALA